MGKTIAQKIFESHLVEKPFADTYVLKLDRVFCHEITTPIAITDLVERNKDRVFDPTKIKAVIDPTQLMTKNPTIHTARRIMVSVLSCFASSGFSIGCLIRLK